MKKFSLAFCVLLSAVSLAAAQTSVTIDANGNVRNTLRLDGTSHKLFVNGVEITGLGGADASDTAKGVVKLSTAPVSPTNPIAVGDNDSRMTNARTPTAHASTHASAGSDPVTLSESQVTGLTSDLAGKEPSIASGTTAQYWRGDKTFVALPTFPANTTATATNFFTAYNSATGAFTKAQPTFTDLAAHPTTVGGYGITDFNSLGDARWQAADTDLTTWAGITPAAGVGTFLATPTLVNLKAAVTDETTVGWNLLTLANPSAISFIQLNADNTVTAQSASAQRTALGLAIGTNVQAWDADLDALAALSGTNTIYYRSAANTWTAVTIGSNLTFSGGTLSATGGGGGTIASTSSVLKGDGAGNAVAATAGTDFLAVSGTAAETITLAPAVNTASAGLTLTDTTAASSGNQQYSPYIYLTGQGWKTTATAASQSVTFRQGVVPVQGTSNPTGLWTIESSVNGGAFGNGVTIDTAGSIVMTGVNLSMGANSTITASSGGLTLTVGAQGTARLTGNYFHIGSNYLSFGSGAVSGSADTAITRVSSGVIEVDNGTTGTLGVILSSRLVTAKTSNYTVTTADKSTVFTNTGAAGTVNFSLPAGVVGNTYTFSIEAAQTFTVTANGSDTIRIAGSVSAGGGNISASTVGNTVTLVCTQTGKWVAIAHEGTWTVT